MSGQARYTRFARWLLVLGATLVTTAVCFVPALADQKTTQEPVRTTMPTGESTHSSKLMMAPVMSADERNGLYLQWGLIFGAGFVVITVVVVWIFMMTRKESATSDDDGVNANAYTVPEAAAEVAPVPSESASAMTAAAAPEAGQATDGASESAG